MQITIQRKNDAVHMEARNEDGNSISIDGAPTVGGENKGFRPMQLLAAGAGSCSTIDIISILKKQRQPLKDIRVEINANRQDGKVPSLFETIHLHYILSGDLDPVKVEKALELSLTKYCSVVKILEKTATITYTYEITNG